MAEQQDSKNSGKLPYRIKEELISRSKLSDEEKAANMAVLVREALAQHDFGLQRSLTFFHQHATNEITRSLRLVQDTVLPRALFDYSQLIGQVYLQIEPVSKALKQMEISLMNDLVRTAQRVSVAYGALTIFPRFPKIKSHPILQDILDVHEHGDRKAAQRLAERIQWRPGGQKGRLIALRAKAERKPFDELLTEALTEGVMRAVPCIGSRLPLSLHNSPFTLSTPDGELMAASPMEWTPLEVWEWLRQETVRAAQTWLFELPYTAAVMLESPPGEDGNFNFAAFAVVDVLALPTGIHQGRPVGSGTFATREELLYQVGQAVRQVRGRGDRATQREVAGVMAFGSIFGLGDPSRQLRHWTTEFGFLDWRDLLSNF